MPQRKVLILTPSADGSVQFEYAHILVETIRAAERRGLLIEPLFVGRDALVQRARNDLLHVAYHSDATDVIWIDADEYWEPEWIFELLGYPVDVVGGTARQKRDDVEQYVCNADPDQLVQDAHGLMPVRRLGTGFLRMSRKAVVALWESGEPYQEKGEDKRWVFDVRPQDGVLHSEDVFACNILRDKGFDIYLAPHMCCAHIGTKIWKGDFLDWLKRFNQQRRAA